MSPDRLHAQLTERLDRVWPTHQPVTKADIRLLAERILRSWGQANEEWSLRDPGSTYGAPADPAFTGVSEAEARRAHARCPGYTLVRRERWTVLTDWEDVP